MASLSTIAAATTTIKALNARSAPHPSRMREHVFYHCPRFSEERERLHSLLYEVMTPENTTRLMLATNQERQSTSCSVSYERTSEIYTENRPPGLYLYYLSTVGKTIARFEQIGSVKDRVRPGRPATSTNEDRSLDVILSFMENPHQSSRSAALELETSDRSVRRILKINKFHPYKVKLVQELNEDNPDRRVEFFFTCPSIDVEYIVQKDAKWLTSLKESWSFMFFSMREVVNCRSESHAERSPCMKILLTKKIKIFMQGLRSAWLSERQFTTSLIEKNMKLQDSFKLVSHLALSSIQTQYDQLASQRRTQEQRTWTVVKDSVPFG
ncbi:unnamed protein product, partial [Trichogramma brassicae]